MAVMGCPFTMSLLSVLSMGEGRAWGQDWETVGTLSPMKATLQAGLEMHCWDSALMFSYV